MKKLFYLIVLALILGLVLTGCLLSNVGQVPVTGQSGITYLTRNSSGELYTEANPFTTELLAGQTINVGEVQVWNDAEYLYITYIIDESGWYLTETHLHVACDGDPIPVNKKGNPKPGQFEYCAEHDYATEYLLAPIPIDCCNPIIAAHAVVVHVAGEVCNDLYSDATETFSAYAGSTCGDTTMRIGTAKLAWEPYSDTDPSVWDEGVLLSYGFTNADWIWEDYRVVNPFCGDVVDFIKTFEIPGLYLVDASVEMHVTCDNGYEFLVNGVSQGSAQLGAGWRSSDLTEDYVTAHGWQSVESYFDFADDLQLGINTLLFQTANEQMDGGTQYSNPGGLIYEGQVCYTVVDQEETAWGAGFRFVEPGNWATYFNYPIQPVCPSITDQSTNIEVLDYIPSDVSVGEFESNDYVQVWKEFEGPLPASLQYDLADGDVAKSGVPAGHPYSIDADTNVCIFYVHFDSEDSTPKEISGNLTFGANILGLIISGGNIGDFADKNLMFTADDLIGYSGTTYPDGTTIYPPNVNYLRGFDVNYKVNTDQAYFSGSKVNFTMYVSNAHDSFRVIVPTVLPCEE